MNEADRLAHSFEAHRSHLRAVAFRMLGSLGEADDAVQEAWLRLNRSGAGGVENLRGWLTTVVARVCLDVLRTRASRREEPLDEHTSGAIASRASGSDLEQEALLADSVGLALLVVLETLSPAERLAFVLHDIFDVPFDQIAQLVGRAPTAARQLASRARRRVRGAATMPEADHTRQREIVEAFLAASRAGDFAALLALLDPDVVLHSDSAAVKLGAADGLQGAEAVARQVAGRARFAQAALVNGAVGVVVAPRGRLLFVISLTVKRGKVVAIDLAADPARLRRLDLAVLGD